MSIIRLLFFLTAVLLLRWNVNAQNYFEKEFLVQIKNGHDGGFLEQEFEYYKNQKSGLRIIEQISEPLNIWHLRYSNSAIPQQHFLHEISRHELVKVAQMNHKISYRATIPNDPQFTSQWQYINTGQNGGIIDADLDADEAWDITTGGTTTQGDTIVIAVIDDGIDLNHVDWGDNVWRNYEEIPANSIDDDNNGYLDDFRGWDAENNNDNIGDGGWHGSSVAGIVGAKGNNSTGVTGVNWNVKLMIIQAGVSEAQAIAGYSYALTQRKRYNQTNGASGAFVVATNSSWGLDLSDPSDAPLWCAFYDSLGKEGILSAGATSNMNVNVDVDGDLPTACPSDYLITVTNITKANIKPTGAGYGLTTIDLGAYGEDTWTINVGGGYTAFGGTSGATPHVAGAVGLLYAAPCPSFITLAKAHPGQAALLAKQYILNGVDSNSSLQGITVTGGHLNLKGALDELLNDCSTSGCVAPFALGTRAKKDTSVILTWSALNYDSFVLRFRESGGPWLTYGTLADTFKVTSLSGCMDYQFQVEAVCGTDSSGFSSITGFTSDGCCEVPAELSYAIQNDSTVEVIWNDVLVADFYNIRYKLAASPVWASLSNLIDTSLIISNLGGCSEYEFQVQTACSGLPNTPFSSSTVFITSGCGFCVDGNYCSVNPDADYEWIEAVKVGNYNNVTGSDDGYGNFSTIGWDFIQGSTYSIQLTPGYFFPDGEYFMAWIDYNQDGTFDNLNEKIFDAGSATPNPVTGSFVLPTSSLAGSTRMRIAMRWDALPSACSVDFGEVEDYCINIHGTAVSCSPPLQSDTFFTDPSTAKIVWEKIDQANYYEISYRIQGDSIWSSDFKTDTTITLLGLQDCRTYEYRLRSICIPDTSQYAPVNVFTTKCNTSAFLPNILEGIRLLPNPFDETLYLKSRFNQKMTLEVSLFSAEGKLISTQQVVQGAGQNNSMINTNAIIYPGVYFIKVMTPIGQKMAKVVKF